MTDASRWNGGSGESSQGTSRSLIQRLQSDEAGAWDRLVALYAPLVAHWCRSSRLSEADLADVFQEVFQAVAANIARFRMDRQGSTFRGWMRAITLNKINDHFRRGRHEPAAQGGSEAQQQLAQVPDPIDDNGSSVGASDADADAALERQLFRRGLEMIRSEFEPRTWQAFWQTTVDGRLAKDVAADLSMSPAAVRVAKSRVLQRLRAELGDLLD